MNEKKKGRWKHEVKDNEGGGSNGAEKISKDAQRGKEMSIRVKKVRKRVEAQDEVTKEVEVTRQRMTSEGTERHREEPKERKL